MRRADRTSLRIAIQRPSFSCPRSLRSPPAIPRSNCSKTEIWLRRLFDHHPRCAATAQRTARLRIGYRPSGAPACRVIRTKRGKEQLRREPPLRQEMKNCRSMPRPNVQIESRVASSPRPFSKGSADPLDSYPRTLARSVVVHCSIFSTLEESSNHQ